MTIQPVPVGALRCPLPSRAPLGASAVALRPDPPAATACCSLQDVLHWAGRDTAGAHPGEALRLLTRRVHADHVLVHQHQALEHFHLVGAGSFKRVWVDRDGTEQVLGFALRGDVIGLDAIDDARHCASVVALEDATVALLPLAQGLDPASAHPALARLLQRAAAVELQRRSETQYLMAAASAEVRAARFLLSMGGRQVALGYSGRRFRLAMSRRDIASYLGVAHETVSRAFTLLMQAGYVKILHRDVEVVDPTALEALARQSRGPSPCAELKRRLRHGSTGPRSAPGTTPSTTPPNATRACAA